MDQTALGLDQYSRSTHCCSRKLAKAIEAQGQSRSSQFHESKDSESHERALQSRDVAADLWLWNKNTPYATAEDWVFTSARVKGQKPRRPDTVMAKIIRPAAVRAGITRRIGWHTFRHTYSTALIGNGENVKVVQ